MKASSSFSSQKKTSAELAQFFLAYADTWHPLFHQIVERMEGMTFSQMLSLDLVHFMKLLEQSSDEPLPRGLLKLSIPVLTALNGEEFDGIDPEELQRFLNRVSVETVEESVTPLCALLTTSRERSAANECGALYLNFFLAADDYVYEPRQKFRLRLFIASLGPLFADEAAGESESQRDLELLGLEEGFTPEELKVAYREKVREWHPDRLNGMALELKEMANERLGEINAAYQRLSERDIVDSAPANGGFDGATTVAIYDKMGQPRPSDERPPAEHPIESKPKPSSASQSGRRKLGIALACVAAAIALSIPIHQLVVERLDTAASSSGTASAASRTEQITYMASATSQKSKQQSGINADPEFALTDDARQSILAELENWSSAFVTNDVDQMSSHYAEHMDRYFLKRNVDKKIVEDSMREWLQKGSRMTSFAIRDEVMTPMPNGNVRVQLVKDIVADEPTGVDRKSIRSEIYLVNQSGAWRISSERDFR